LSLAACDVSGRAEIRNTTAADALSSIYSVHDGWGIAAKEGIEGNAIEAGDTTNMDTIAKEHSFRSIRAHGTAVGLNEGLMGNSEVGFVLVEAHFSSPIRLSLN
jgi:Metalloenzyme superfamily